MFEELIKLNCFSQDQQVVKEAGERLEQLYGCEINCTEIDESVLFAHHARGCTIIAAKICENAVIYQNVTIGSNMKYNKMTKEWENVGNPIIGRNVIVADGAKILGPITIGENTVVGAGAIITKSIPANCVAYGVNQYKLRDLNYDLLFSRENMLDSSKIIAENKRLIAAFEKNN